MRPGPISHVTLPGVPGKNPPMVPCIQIHTRYCNVGSDSAPQRIAQWNVLLMDKGDGSYDP